MKENQNNKKAGLKFLFSVVAFAALMLMLVLNINKVFEFFGWLWDIFKPLVLGGCIAFVVNMLMVWFEKKVFRKMHRKKLRNVLSLIAAFLVVLAIIVIALAIVIPQLVTSFGLLSESLPRATTNFLGFVDRMLTNYPYLNDMLNTFVSGSQDLSEQLIDYVRDRLSRTLTQTFAAASYTVSAVATFLVGLIFSLYILLSKKQLGRQARQLCYTYLPVKKANKLLYIFHLTSENFYAFIKSQCIEAVILMVMYMIVATIFRLPYALMISTIIGVFSLIPLFGAWIGWGIGVFLIVTVRPFDAITFSILFLIISQIEANLIYPRIVGSSIGLPGIWVLASVTVGANMLGITGMIIAVPIAALCYTLISENSQKRLRGKTAEVADIIYKPDWAYFNPETDMFEDKPVVLENVLSEENVEKVKKEEKHK